MSLFDKLSHTRDQNPNVEEMYGYEPEQEEPEDEGNFLDKMVQDMKQKRQRSMAMASGVR